MKITQVGFLFLFFCQSALSSYPISMTYQLWDFGNFLIVYATQSTHILTNNSENTSLSLMFRLIEVMDISILHRAW